MANDLLKRAYVGALALCVAAGCSFSLAERTVCINGECPQPNLPDQALPPTDMNAERTDPNEAGPFLWAYQELSVPPSLYLQENKLAMMWPSDEGTNPSTKKPIMPLVVMLPAQNLSVTQLRPYAERLATHGIATALMKVSDERRQVQYRDLVLAVTQFLVQTSSVKGQIQSDRIGLHGYQLGGMVAGSALSKSGATFRSALLIDPVAVPSFVEPLDALKDVQSVALPKTGPLLLLGETLSKVGEPGLMPCTPADANYEQFFGKLGGAALALTLTGATHSDFVASYPDQCGTPTLDRATTRRLSIKYTTAYFQWTLLDRTAASEYLVGTFWTADRVLWNLASTSKGL